MPKRSDIEVTSWHVEKADPVCPLCERPIPKSQRDEHHLVPKSRGGRLTETLHRICHRQIHALFTEKELEKTYFSVEALLSHEAMRKFVDWVKTKPDGFVDGARRSHRRR